MLRARGIEVVDGDGRPRVLIGEAGGASAPFGLWILDAAGSRRIWLGVDAGEASLALGRGGTVVAALGSHGATEDDVGVTAYAFVAAADGRPVAGWLVADDGSVRVVEPP